MKVIVKEHKSYDYSAMLQILIEGLQDDVFSPGGEKLDTSEIDTVEFEIKSEYQSDFKQYMKITFNKARPNPNKWAKFINLVLGVAGKLSQPKLGVGKKKTAIYTFYKLPVHKPTEATLVLKNFRVLGKPDHFNDGDPEEVYNMLTLLTMWKLNSETKTEFVPTEQQLETFKYLQQVIDLILSGTKGQWVYIYRDNKNVSEALIIGIMQFYWAVSVEDQTIQFTKDYILGKGYHAW